MAAMRLTPAIKVTMRDRIELRKAPCHRLIQLFHSPLTLASGVERIFPTADACSGSAGSLVHGQVRSIRAGEVLFEAGEHVVPSLRRHGRSARR